MKNLLTILSFIWVSSLNGQEHYLLVGTYDSPKSEGIHVYRFNSNDGSSKAISHIKTSNPSFLAISPDNRFVYAVREKARNGEGGEIAAFSFNKISGELTLLNAQLSGGDHPCYVDIDKTGKWVFAGNYTSGSFAVLPVKEDGSLGEATSVIRHTGSGPDTVRQKGSHVHATVINPDNNYVFVPDLGTDKVMIYAFDDVSGKVEPARETYAASLPGTGPRHFTFDPKNEYAYLVEEMGGNVVTYKYKKGKLSLQQSLSAMPAGDSRFPGSADIHVSPDGKFLYVSNRGDVNSIAIFSISGKSGKLKLIGHQTTLGKTPRNFNFDPSGKFLLVANQNSDEIVVFSRDLETGLLTDSGKRIAVGKPVCIKWVSLQ